MIFSSIKAVGTALYANAYLMLIFTTLSWGGNAIFGRLAVGEISPMLLTCMRWIGVAILLLLFARKKIRDEGDTLKRHWRYFAAMGALGFAVFNALYYVAAHSTTAINLGILQGSIPVFVMIGAFLVFRTPTTLLQSVGVVVTMAGVVVVTTKGQLASLSELAINPGDLIMLFACGLYAGYTVCLRKRPQISGIARFSGMAFAALIVSIPLAIGEFMQGQMLEPTVKGWVVLGFVVLFPSFVAQICFMRGVELIGPGRAGVFINLVPIFASIMSVMILGEHFQLFHAASLALVLGGIWIAEKGKPVS